MPHLSVLIKPVSSRCNLRCAYCFYADEVQRRSIPDSGVMQENTVRMLVEKSMAAAEGSVTYLFQGGEPTLAGLDFFRRFAAMAERQKPRGLEVRYAIQTNGTLLNEEWCSFFARNRFLVGLSLDGCRACHDRFRRNAAGKGTYDQALRASRLLDQAGAAYNILTVVTGYLARHIQSVYSALGREGFLYQQYIPCLDPIEERRGQREYSLSPVRYEEFLKRLFDLWWRELEQGKYRSIRYFDNLIRMLEGNAPEQCSMRGICGVQYLVEADGSVYPCDFYGLDEYCLGNVWSHTWPELDRMREALGFIEASRRIPEPCAACRWYSLCRNGCRRDRLLEENGLNYYCRAYAGFFDYATPRLQRAGVLLKRGLPTGMI